MGNSVVTLIRLETLRDERYPVSAIAEKLIPYLTVLVEQFRPDQIILFGSFAYGRPTRHSDVDLLIVKELNQSPVREAIAIRRAWRTVRETHGPLPFDLIVVSPEEHERRLRHSAGFYSEINTRGLHLL